MRPYWNHTMTSNQMTIISDVTPIFTTDPAAPPGNLVPVLARLLIDAARRQKLTNDGRPTMLKGVVFGSLPSSDSIGVAHG